jgi:hypothetical protein
VLSAYRRHDGKVKEVWEVLQTDDPGILDVMKWHTFRTYFIPFVLIVQAYEDRPNHVAGWTVRKDKDGYYRGKRRLHDKLQSVYLGKEFDREAFTVKVRQKENKFPP